MKKIISFLLVLFCFISNNLSASDKYSDQENKIFKNLRCLICQGQSIYDSQSDFSESMKIVVRKNLQEGMSEKEIYNSLKNKYGEWVLYDPQVNKGTYLLWSLPLMLFLLGGAIILRKLSILKK
jgi:cytochrome c-type biogenesis protein CcmH